MLAGLLSSDDRERAARVWRRSRLHAQGLWRRYGVWRMRGTLHGSERRISLLAIGPPGFEIQLHSVFLQRCEQTRRLAELGRLDDGAAWLGSGDDVVARVRRPWEGPRAGELDMTLAVDARIPVETTPAEHVARHVAEQHRRALKHRDQVGAEYQLSRSAEDLRWWHEKLYAPLTLLRHREQAVVEPLADFELRLPRMEILLARRRGEVVAGVLLEHDPWYGTLTRSASGALPAVAQDGKLYKVLTVALEYAGLERAHQRGIARYSLGFTLPRVDAGLFAYKRRWGAAFVPFPWSWPTSITLGPRTEILARTPIITQSPAGPTVLLGATDDGEPALAALHEQIKLASFPNARSLVVHAAPAHAPRIRAALSARGLTGVTVHTELPAQS